MGALPTGTVTFLFTDIEGSTRLLQQLGDRYAEAIATHHRLLRTAIQEAQGQVVDTQGDAVFAVFPRARDALLAAIAAQRAVLAHPWPDGAAPKVRIGLHTGEPITGETGYVGMDVHRAARIAAAGHGGQILVSNATQGLVTTDLPEGVSLRDLGEHRLKDLDRAHRLFQVVAADLPANFLRLRSLDVLPNNLPRQLTSFIGREKEMAEVKRLLSTAHLVTLTGSGGSGKTRLALQVAADVAEAYPGGAWLAEFAPIADPALVPKTAATALNVPEQPGRDMTETLVDALRHKALLLVLDNCEHLLASCRDLAATLLRQCPQVRILATSREGLGVPGETLWRVPSLSVPKDVSRLPPPEEIVLYDAVRLFADRAVATTPGFTVTSKNASAVTQICQRLDGIPLAIELAAARVKVLAVEQIAARLDDRFRLLTGGSAILLPRHQTLRATMDWSYGLLSEQEQTLLRRLSVFAGGWAVEAAEAVCSGAGIEATSILDLLTSLVGKSLVVVETQGSEARYRMLETVRQYGNEELQIAGEETEMRQRHCDWCLALAERGGAELPKQTIWMDRLETEHDNLRSAFEWTMAKAGGRREGLRLSLALTYFWRRSGYWGEAHQWLEEGLKYSGDPSMRAKVLEAAAQFAWRLGKDERASTLAEEGLALCREVDDKEHAALCLYWLGNVAIQQREYDRAKRFDEESLSLCLGLENKFVAGLVLNDLGQLTRYQGDCEQAIAIHERALAMAKSVGDASLCGLVLSHLGMDYHRLGDYPRAVEHYRESLLMCKESRNRWVPVRCLYGLGDIACVKQHLKRASRLFGAASQLEEVLGICSAPADQEWHNQYTAAARARLEESAFAAAWAEGRAMTLEQAIEYALADEAN